MYNFIVITKEQKVVEELVKISEIRISQNVSSDGRMAVAGHFNEESLKAKGYEYYIITSQWQTKIGWEDSII